MKNEKLAYFAGLMDGEGCFNINFNKRRETYQARLTMTNTNTLLVNWCADKFGGKVYLRKKYNIRHKEKWEWMCWGNKESLVRILKDIFPYLVGKKEQCKTLIEFQETLNKIGEHKRLTDEIKDKRKSLYERIKVLNRTGLAETE